MVRKNAGEILKFACFPSQLTQRLNMFLFIRILFMVLINPNSNPSFDFNFDRSLLLSIARFISAMKAFESETSYTMFSMTSL
nr:hypothetical protein KV8917_350060 [Klebsiella variicola]